MAKQPTRQDIYTRVTNQIAQQLEQGVRPWIKPWSVEHTAGRITRPLRHNAIPYRGVNVLLLWSEALAKGYAAPLWMTYRQSQELGAQVRKGEHGSLVVFADRFTKTETNDQGESVEHAIPFMKGYTVFNVEQIEGLPAHYYAQPSNPLPLSDRLTHADQFVTATGVTIRHGGNQAYYSPAADHIQLPPFEAFKDKESYYATVLHELTRLATQHVSIVISAGSVSATRAMPAKSWSQNWAPRSSVPTSASPRRSGQTMPTTSVTGSKSLPKTITPSSRPPLMRNAPLTSCSSSNRLRRNRLPDFYRASGFTAGGSFFCQQFPAGLLPHSILVMHDKGRYDA